MPSTMASNCFINCSLPLVEDMALQNKQHHNYEQILVQACTKAMKIVQYKF
jgi:hypothetical protein